MSFSLKKLYTFQKLDPVTFFIIPAYLEYFLSQPAELAV